MKVRIFIESTWRGPSKRDGVAMWLVEYMRGDEPVTRQGFVHVENGTEAQGNLMALINAFLILRKSCSALVFTQCEHILNTMQNHWHIQWQKDDWHNAKGKPVKNVDLWKMFVEKTENHTYTIQGGWHDYQNVMQIELQKEFAAWKAAEDK